MIRVICGHSSLGSSLKKKTWNRGINLILIHPYSDSSNSWNGRERPRLTGNERVISCRPTIN